MTESVGVVQADPPPPDVSRLLASYRSGRRAIEQAILPIATSLDGRSFTFQASLHGLQLHRGGYVVVEVAGAECLGQVTDLRVDSVSEEGVGLVEGSDASILIRLAVGTGIMLDVAPDPFHDAAVRPASPAEVRAWSERTGPSQAGLTVGELSLAPGVPATLHGAGLNRHTFMCGQSGSGKTYSLGLLLERVLAETSLRVVVLDPNSDHVGLSTPRASTDADLAARYVRAAGDVVVWGNGPTADRPLRLRFTELDTAARGAILGLDPVRDLDEYAVLAGLVSDARRGEMRGVADVAELADSEVPAVRRLGQRALNLGVLEWSVWGPDSPSLIDELRNPTARCTVIDIGGLDTAEEQRVVAEATLTTLWNARLDRQPCLMVVDEAHNVCPAVPADAISGLSTERAIQIAAEGRKYGLYLLTSTQRPHKVHDNIVSQCDNLLMMRMNSQADVDAVGRLLSFVPAGLLAGATSFQMGQALVAGRLCPYPAYVQMGARMTEEGGADIPTDWAAPRV